MIVNAGRAQNVESGQAVVDDKGLIGRVVDTGRQASRVLLLTDIQSRVPIYIEDVDVEGILVGKTRQDPAISITRLSEEIEVVPGQRVLTSGAGGALPRGLPIGEVKTERNGEIVVDLYADYAQTRLVRIINYEFPAVGEVVEEDIESENAALTEDAAENVTDG